MKVAAIFVFLAAIVGTITSLPRVEDGQSTADQIKLIIIALVANLPESFEIKDLTYTLPSDSALYGELNLKELSLSGYKQFSIDTLTLDDTETQLGFSVTFEELITLLETELVLHGVAELEHALSVNMDLKKIKIEGDATLAEDKKSLEELSVLITLEDADFDISGLLNNEDMSKTVSEYLSEHFAEFITEAAPMLSPIVSDFLKDIINQALADSK